MLIYLQIKNFTIIKNESVEFSPGLNIITGESGSGKSLIFDAIYQILGARANTEIISPNEDYCEITAQFDIRNNTAATELLRSLNIAVDECVITRSIYRNKPSKCQINGNIVSQKELKNISQKLLHIHSQHQNFSLCEANYQKHLLDQYAANEKTLSSLKCIYKKLQQTRTELNTLQKNIAEQHDRLAILDFHLQELLQFENICYDQSKVSYDKQNNILSFQKYLDNSLNTMYDSDQATIAELQHITAKYDQYSSSFPEAKESIMLIESAIINLTEAARELKNITNTLCYQPEEIANLAEIIDKMQDIARKHRVLPQELHQVKEKLEQQKQDILQSQTKFDALALIEKQQLQQYYQISKSLHEKRTTAAIELQNKICQLLPELGIESGKFNINIKFDIEKISIDGQDEIDFMFSANPGHALATLDKVASGGELSRLSLIVEAITLTKIPKSCILFDEIDTGVSGKVARDIALMLRSISNNTQVMCITHLPQIASLATNHYTVAKLVENTKTFAKINKLDKEGHIYAVAKLMGGNTVEESAIVQAKQLCES